MGGEGGAVFVGERNGLLGVTGDGEEAVVMVLVVAGANVDHVLDRGGSVNSVFEDMVCLGLADALTFQYSTWSIAESKIAILSKIGMVRGSDEPRRQSVGVAVLDIDPRIAQNCLKPRVVYRRTVFDVE